MSTKPAGPATTLIHAGEGVVDEHPLVTPIYETTTFVFDSAAALVAFNEGRSSRFMYSRYGNPTIVAVERQVAAADGAEAGLVFSSGMAATATILMGLTAAGDEIVAPSAIYGGTWHLLQDLLPRFGVTARLVSLADLADPDRVIGSRTKVLWFETPVNPTLRCVDIRTVAEACRRRQVVSVLDNTFASPVNQRPLALGVDLAMQSATKYLNGHSDVTAGCVTGSAARLEAIGRARRLLGTVLDPLAAHALGRGLKTLSVRVARQNATAAAVAAFLDADPRVSAVYYPGLASHPDHAIARAQMQGFGGMVCFDLGGDYARAAASFDRLSLIKRAASLGGVETIVSLPVLTSHWGHTDDQLKAAGITRGMLRLSVGLEDPEDLIADLDQALV